MANEEHLAVLRQGVDAWNAWRHEHPDVVPDLSEAELTELDLSKANFTDTNLKDADLSFASLISANLRGADLYGAHFYSTNLLRASLAEAHLYGAHLAESDFHHVDFHEADLAEAKFRGAGLSEASLDGAKLYETLFANVDLSATRGLDACVHEGPSVLDHRTLQRSGRLPLAFLRGCGLPDRLIDYLPSLLDEAIQYHSCFISYSSKDEEFAERLHADLQNNGVRCWFAAEDMKIGDKFRQRIDEAIHVHERLLLILSENSVLSEWVEKEVEAAFEKEQQQKRTVLFPVRLDDAVMECRTGWSADIRRTRHIGDFRRWKDHDACQQAFSRVLRDLKSAPG
jgi:TIR domain/Pentapeptide repeats (9 copies)